MSITRFTDLNKSKDVFSCGNDRKFSHQRDGKIELCNIYGDSIAGSFPLVRRPDLHFYHPPLPMQRPLL